ncbi:alpha/beta hydrolase, partial [Staphylococcus aureus]|nr:alpha/beta hydrolase [Staphylococcus aureus]
GLREYSLDIGRLKASPVTVVPAGGIDSQGCLPYRYAKALADHLKTKVVDCPGNHVGCVLYPEDFAEKLDMVFRRCNNKNTKG